MYKVNKILTPSLLLVSSIGLTGLVSADEGIPQTAPPVQAEWDGAPPVLSVKVKGDSKTSTMGETELFVEISTKLNDSVVLLSPLIQATRGIKIVVEKNGHRVQPQIPLPPSPPAPPVPASNLIRVSKGNPYKFVIREQSKNLFPRVGFYHISINMSLVDFRGGNPKYAYYKSNSFTVTVK